METTFYEQVSPPAQLAHAIDSFWRLSVPLVIAPDEIISAEGRAEILFQFKGRSQILSHDSTPPFECATSWLMRPYAQALHVRQVDISSAAMIGVRFMPGGWAAFQHNDTTDSRDYWFMPLSKFYELREVRLLEEELYDAFLTPNWANPLITFFLKRQIEPHHFDRVAYVVRRLNRQQIRISTLAHEVNLSERQLARVFRQQVGLSAKRFSRITRLNRVLNLSTYEVSRLTLEQLALNHGYHDASHLTREFRELVDLTPLTYFSGSYDLIDQKFRENDRFLQWE